MNKRDAINHIRQFGGRLDRFRKSVGGSGDGGRNAPKRAKSSPKPVNRKTNVFNEQVRYAFHGALQDLKSKPFATFLTVMVIAISLTLPSVCYMVYKNVNQAATQYYPSPQITVYLQKTLDDDAAAGVVAQLQSDFRQRLRQRHSAGCRQESESGIIENRPMPFEETACAVEPAMVRSFFRHHRQPR